MMSTEGQSRTSTTQANTMTAFKTEPHSTSYPSTTTHNEQTYFQMSSMRAPPPIPPSTTFTTAAASHQSNLPFFSSVHSSSPYSMNTVPKVEYTVSDRAISDEMMRHLLLSANSLPPNVHQGQSLNVSSQPQLNQSSFTTAASTLKEDKTMGGKGKVKRGRQLAPGEKPVRKKKRRAFEFYWEELRSDYAKTHSHLGHNERRAIAQAEWKNVTDREKWQKQADDYNEKMLDEKYKHRPKPPVTANAFFFKEQHVLLRQQRPELKGGAVLAEISKMWERCSDRSRWIEMQAADRRRYENEMATYKANQSLGHL